MPAFLSPANRGQRAGRWRGGEPFQDGPCRLAHAQTTRLVQIVQSRLRSWVEDPLSRPAKSEECVLPQTLLRAGFGSDVASCC